MKQILKWEDSLSTGFDEIDLQHKKLILIIDEVYQISLLDQESFQLAFPKTIKKLTDYTEYHFSEEEKFMKRYDYPELAGHQKEHGAFIGEVSRQISGLARATPNDAYQFYRFLGQWLLTHIAKSDQAWAAHIRAAQAKKK